MDELTNFLLEFISAEDNPLGLLIIAASAMIEYIIPPFPGDTITLFGAILITAYGWNFWAVFGVVMAGSVAGSMLAFYIGSWLQARRERRHADDPGEQAEQRALLDRLVEKFHRHGAAYLVINRFLPGIRAVFFVAAGMAHMRPIAVLGYSAISAALWNLGIIALGSALGANFDALLSAVRQYTIAVWIGVCAICALWLIRALYRRRNT